jgi:acetylornithine deacetylase
MPIDRTTTAILNATELLSVEALDRLRHLLEASRDGEDATQTEVMRQLAEIGLTPDAIQSSPAEITTIGEFADPDDTDLRIRTTVAARGAGAGGGRSLLLWAHPDGMPFDGGQGWIHEPFTGVVQDGRIYGWGIADDLSGVAATIMTVRTLQQAGLNLRGDLVLASTPSKGHASGILAAMSRGFTADGGLYLHPAESGNGLGDIKALASGMLRFRLVVHGSQPDTREPNHTLYAHQAVNPIWPMNAILAALNDLDEARSQRLRHPVLEGFAGRSTSMLVATLQAGETPSRVPKTCEAVVAFQLPPGEVLEEARSEVQSVIDRVTTQDAWLREHPPEVTWLFGTTGVDVPAEHPLYQTVSNATSSLTGNVPRYYPGHTASEIRQPILNHGMPAVGIGPLAGSLSQAGGADEWLDIDDYQRMIGVCALTAAHWCGVAGD